MNRFNDELNSAANDQSVSFTGVDTVIRTAKHRSRRRAIATSVGTVGAVTAVTVIGVSQLSRPADPTEPVAAPPAATGDEYPPAVPASTTPAAPPGTAPATTAYGEPMYPEIPGAVPATATEPMVNWRRVAADSPEALTLKLDSSQQYAISTSEGSTSVLYENVDGNWQQIAQDIFPPGIRRAAVSRGTVYGLGTVEGNRKVFVEYDPGTTRLSEIDLPPDAVGYESERVSNLGSISSTPIADGLLIGVSKHWPHIRDDLITEMYGQNAYGEKWDGNSIRIVKSCEETMPSSPPPTGPDSEYCDIVDASASDLGLTPTDVDALEAGPVVKMYKYTATGFEEVSPPVDDAAHLHIYEDTLTLETRDGTRTFAIAGDGSLTEVFTDQQATFGARVNGDRATFAFGPYLGAQTVGDPASIVTDVGPLIGEGADEPDLELWSADTTRELTVATGMATFYPADTPDEAVSAEASGYELRYTPGQGVQVIDTTTGDGPEFMYDLATESGTVQLYKTGEFLTTVAPGSVPGSTTPATYTAPELVAEFPVDPASIRPFARRTENVLVSTVDGTSVAVERLTDLVELAPDEAVVVDEIRAANGQIVVTVQVYAKDEGPHRRTIHLVGTPK